MDAEKSEVSDTQKQEETVVEKEVKVDSTEPENPPAAMEEAKSQEASGQAAEGVSTKEMEEPVVTVEDQSDKEPEPNAVAPPESAESPKKVSDPVANLDTQPESTEPVPENIPEPLQAHQAEGAPEPEPEKPAERVPEAASEEKPSPVPAMGEQPVEAKLPVLEEKASEQVKAEGELHTATEAETVKQAAVEPVQEKAVSSEKPVEAATVKESAEVGSGEPAKDQKGDKLESEQKDAEPPREDNVVPASGSLSFAILEQDTKDALRTSRTLVVLRGLPGSGKSFLARAIADAYKDQCSVFCADNHGIKPENPKSSADGYKALDEAIVARCSEGTSSVLVVVDDTNHTHDRLACLGEIAKEHNLVTLFLEPQTEWSRDLTQLKKKSSRGLEEAQLDAMKGPLVETSLPLFFGWFLLPSVQDKVKCTAMDFLKMLDMLDEFKNHLADCECRSKWFSVGTIKYLI